MSSRGGGDELKGRWGRWEVGKRRWDHQSYRDVFLSHCSLPVPPCDTSCPTL